MTSSRLSLGGIALLNLTLAIPGSSAERASPATLTNLNIAQATAGLAAAQPSSPPEEVAQAIQARLDYFYLHHLSGRVTIPAGNWSISKPLFANGDNVEIVGDGRERTTLRAADGFKAMPMVNIGARTSFEQRPMQECNRIRLTDPAARVLDGSVTGERYGLRTYAEFPSTRFPGVSHLAITVHEPKNWAAGVTYKENDIIKLDAPGSPRPLESVCIREHVSDAATEPFKGDSWKAAWVVKLPFHVQFTGDPLAAGAYEPAAARATDWEGMRQFTFDFAYTLNADIGTYGGARMLCGIVMEDISRASGRGWILSVEPDGRLLWDVSLLDGTFRRVELAKGCGAPGTYRLALQVDFDRHSIHAWVRRPGEAGFAPAIADLKALPENSGFHKVQYGYFMITGGDSGSAPGSNGALTPPTDLTVCGLHMSAALRYDEGESVTRRDTGAPPDDSFSYFSNDAGTMAFLPLLDHPDPGKLRTDGLLVTVQHGPASGDPGQKGYGYFKVPANIFGIGRPRVSDLTIKPGPVWGMGIVTWHTLNALLANLDLRGGYYAIGDLFYGAQYPIEVRDSLLSGSEAAYNGSSNIVYMRNVEIDPVGRFGILVSGSNMTLDHVRFGDPRPHQSEYYFRSINTVLYGGMNLLSNISAEAPAGSRFPSRAAFSLQNIWTSRTSVVLRDCAVSNLGPAAAFLELPFSSGPSPDTLLLDRCSYHGDPIATWVRTDAPWWSGVARVSDPDGKVRKLQETSLPPAAPWKSGSHYQRNSLVRHEEGAWLCLADHVASAESAPGAAGAEAFWTRAIPRIVFEAKR